MLRIAIDGACRRNGKPDCISSGGVFIMHYNDANELVATETLSSYEVQSTNQRGELLALLAALDKACFHMQCTHIITDSEYIFNTMTKEWFNGWESRGWLTASMEPVKNSDIWKKIVQIYRECIDLNVDITFYHIKGHCIPFGKVAASTLLSKDCTGEALMNEAYKKYDIAAAASSKQKLLDANTLSLKNNGFELSDDILKEFVVMNTVVDAVATKCVEAADSLLS